MKRTSKLDKRFPKKNVIPINSLLTKSREKLKIPRGIVKINPVRITLSLKDGMTKVVTLRGLSSATNKLGFNFCHNPSQRNHHV